MNPLIVSRTNDHGDYKKYVKVELEESIRIGRHGYECTKMKHAFEPVVAGEERKISGLKHAHMLSMVEDNSYDKISDLPDDILRNIISLLPLESAAQTRLLSTRWRQVWDTKSSQKGSIDSMANAITTFLNSVDWVKPLARPWKLHFHSTDGCVLEASTGANNKLLLDSSHGESSSPWKFYLDLELSSRNPKLQPCPSSFPVRFLCLKSVNNLSSEVVSSVLLSLHFLESLEVRECKGMFGMSVNAGWKLKHLTIIDCYQLRSISILGHALERLRYRGKFPEIFMVGLSNFKDLMLDFRQGVGYDDYTCLTSHSLLILFLKDAEFITLCEWTFQVMIRPKLDSEDPDAQFKYLKELWWICSSMEEENINLLISFLQVCPKIEKLYITIDPTCYNLPRKGGGEWTSKVHSIKIKGLEFLKVVKMEGLKSEEDELLLANCIFKIAITEPLVTATSRNSYSTRRLVKISPNQRKFVEEIDTDILESKHMHNMDISL
ncbi:hypothetical protein V2J09_001271 [Rumex salicifolius]